MSRNRSRSPGGPGRKRDTTYSAGPGGHLSLAPGFSRSGEHVGPGPSRTLIPLLQRPPDVTRYPHAWTATRIRAHPPRNLKSGPAPRGALQPHRIPGSVTLSKETDHPGRKLMVDVTLPPIVAQEDRGPNNQNPADRPRHPKARAGHQVRITWPHRHSTPPRPTQRQSADPNSVTDTYLEHHGTRAQGCPGHANTHILMTYRKLAGRPKISNVTCN